MAVFDSGRRGPAWLTFLVLALALVGAVAATGRPTPAMAVTTITVNSNADGTNAALAANATCDLREAIRTANANATVGDADCPVAGSVGLDIIVFNTAANIITLVSGLPGISDALEIDGANLGGANIEIDVNSTGGPGLNIEDPADGSTIRNLFVYESTSHGIRVRPGANNVTIDLVYTGLTGAGLAAPNADHGVLAESVSNLIINNSQSSGNTRDGYRLENVTTAAITRSWVGVNFAGTGPLPNGGNGITVIGGSGVVIGGATNAHFNFISGNTGDGVLFDQATGAGNMVLGNWIGSAQDGVTDIGNGRHGVSLRGSTGVQVGGFVHPLFTCDQECNVISGNGNEGVHIEGGGSNTVVGNFIGTTEAGEAALQNDNNGVAVVDSNSNAIGNLLPGGGNLISGNNDKGVRIAGTSTLNTIAGNRIGTDDDGAQAVPNVEQGVIFQQAAVSNTVRSNLVSGNGRDGILLSDLGGFNTVAGNLVGTNALGQSGALGNGEDGVYVESSDNLIGGTIAADRNVFCDHGFDGVHVEAGARNDVFGNYIGIAADGASDCGNDLDGVYAEDAAGLEIGSAAAGSGNVISFNGDWGVHLHTGETSIRGNIIGLAANGSTLAPNGDDGVAVHFPANTVAIGGPTPAERNIISGNMDDGIEIEGASSVTIYGNFIGTDITGLLDRGNGDSTASSAGVAVYAGSNIEIGGTLPGQANLIAFNKANGVAIHDATSIPIRLNSIHSNLFIGIDLDVDPFAPADGVTLNDPGDADIGGNDLLNFPVLISAAGTQIAGRLDGHIAADYDIDFFMSPTCDPSMHGEGQTYLGTLALNAGGNTPFNFTANQLIPGNFCVTATATVVPIRGLNGSTSEFSRGILAQGTDLRVDKAMNPFTSLRGAVVTYRIRVRSLSGPSDNVVLTDVLPAFHRFQSWTGPAPAGCNTLPFDTNGTITCNIGSMTASSSRLYTFTVKLPLEGEVPDGVPLNTATVTTTTPEQNKVNNKAIAKPTLP